MKKNIIITGLMLVCCFLAGYFGPWWAPAAAVLLIAALLSLPARRAAWAGGIALGVAYLAMALFLRSYDQAEILQKTGNILGGLSSGLLLVITVLIGLVTGLLSGWLGSALAGSVKRHG